jgi:hypothetical protein
MTSAAVRAQSPITPWFASGSVVIATTVAMSS